MLVLGIESSCDETGIALYDTKAGLLSHTLHSQIALHSAYGGVVPELASRDHIRHLIPLLRESLARSRKRLLDIDHIAYTQGPGLAGALLVGTAFAEALAVAIDKPVLPVHHLEGHLLSPLLSANPPEFPFIALLVSGGHTQLIHVKKIGHYELLGDTLDDAAGEAFDKSAKLLGLPYPGGALLSQLAKKGRVGIYDLPRPMRHSGDLNFSFSGLKTAVLTAVQKLEKNDSWHQSAADIALAFQSAVVDVLAEKSCRALQQTGLKRLVVAGGVGANDALRETLQNLTKKIGAKVFFPEIEFCTDNGAMIALAGALRVMAGDTGKEAGAFVIKARWTLH